MYSKQFGTQRIIKKQAERESHFGYTKINQAIATNTPSALVLLQLIGVTVGVSGTRISISTLP